MLTDGAVRTVSGKLFQMQGAVELTKFHTSETFYTYTNSGFAQPVGTFYVFLFLHALLISVDVPSVFPLLIFGTNYLPQSGSPTRYFQMPAIKNINLSNHLQRITNTPGGCLHLRFDFTVDHCAQYKYFLFYCIVLCCNHN